MPFWPEPVWLNLAKPEKTQTTTHMHTDLSQQKKTFCLLSRKIIKSKKLEINHWSVYLISRVKSVIVVTTVVIVVQLIFHAPFRHGHLYGQFRHLVCSNWAKTNKQVQLLAGGTIFKIGKLSKLFIQHILFIVKQWQARYDANDEQGHDNNRTKVGILTFDYALKSLSFFNSLSFFSFLTRHNTVCSTKWARKEGRRNRTSVTSVEDGPLEFGTAAWAWISFWFGFVLPCRWLWQFKRIKSLVVWQADKFTFKVYHELNCGLFSNLVKFFGMKQFVRAKHNHI